MNEHDGLDWNGLGTTLILDSGSLAAACTVLVNYLTLAGLACIPVSGWVAIVLYLSPRTPHVQTFTTS